MRKLCAFGLVLGVAALLASPALAQPGGGRGMFGGGGIGMLLTNKSVQEEAKIDKDTARLARPSTDSSRGLCAAFQRRRWRSAQ